MTKESQNKNSYPTIEKQTDDLIVVPVRLYQSQIVEIKQIVGADKDTYNNFSQFIRSAVFRRLRELRGESK